MRRTYTLTLEVDAPDDTDTDSLDETVENVVQWSTARDAIETGIGTDHEYGVASLRVERVGICNHDGIEDASDCPKAPGTLLLVP